MAYTTINKSSSFQNQVIYTGNGSTQSVTGVGFQPDWTWCKQRNTARNHGLFDAVRGVTKILYSNDSSGQATAATSLTSFNSDGFSCGGETETNANGGTYVSWNWKANGAGSANTAGSINSTVSVSATSGFSIVSYTGTGANATIGHGLGSVPKMIITKSTGAVAGWGVYHQSLGNTNALFLEESTATSANSVYWNNTSPTSSVFSVGSAGAMNNTNGMIAYCFAEKQGYSKFGSYTGNGNADGTFVYTGFKPAFVMCKASSVGGSVGYAWSMFDNKRSSYNIERSQLEANTSDAQQTDASGDIDLLSNGFKFRSSASENNQSGATYIYMAFAEAPLVGTNNIPANAR